MHYKYRGFGSSSGVLSVSMPMICLRKPCHQEYINNIISWFTHFTTISTRNQHAVFLNLASGMTKVSPIWWLNLEATSRVISRCCNWSFPTIFQHHIISLSHQHRITKSPALTSNRSDLSLKECAKSIVETEKNSYTKTTLLFVASDCL
jgi:hypothetical protein